MTSEKTLDQILSERGWPNDAFALVADIDKSTASRVRAGKTRPLPRTVIRMAQGLGISVTRMRSVLDATWRQAHAAADDQE